MTIDDIFPNMLENGQLAQYIDTHTSTEISDMMLQIAQRAIEYARDENIF